MSGFAVASGSTRGLADAQAFAAELAAPAGSAAAFFASGRPLWLARAPGRLDLMGGIADYSGSLVLQWPLHEATLVAAQRDPDLQVRVKSVSGDGEVLDFAAPLEVLAPGGVPVAYETARAFFAERPPSAWAAYVAGALLVLMRERGVRFGEGVRLLVRSDVPLGKGVSSSAALEVASMQALAGAFDVALEPRELALLCQMVENRVVGAACGVMDQMTSACGREGALLALLCQPAEILGQVAVPPEVEIHGLDSGERHAVSGSDYTAVRVGAFMGARILEDLGVLAPGPLVALSPSQVEPWRDRIPEQLSGADFLARYGATRDPVTRVAPERVYAVRTPTLHPIHEHFRVQAFRELLAPPIPDERLSLLGELMYQSHASYTACGLGSPGTDRLVALVREAGPGRGFFGAKITGGGSGGTVAVLSRRGADLGPLLGAYARERGHPPRVFRGSSPGAMDFGRLRLVPGTDRS